MKILFVLVGCDSLPTQQTSSHCINENISQCYFFIFANVSSFLLHISLIGCVHICHKRNLLHSLHVRHIDAFDILCGANRCSCEFVSRNLCIFVLCSCIFPLWLFCVIFLQFLAKVFYLCCNFVFSEYDFFFNVSFVFQYLTSSYCFKLS